MLPFPFLPGPIVVFDWKNAYEPTVLGWESDLTFVVGWYGRLG